MFNTNPGKQSFTAAAGQTVFNFNFKIYEDTDLKVYLTPTGQDPNDANDILTITTDYTVTIDGDDGGTVTLTSGATLNDTIVIARDLPQVRDTSYVTNGDLKAATLNVDQDYQTYLIIDGYTALDNVVQLPQSAVGVDPVLPNVRPDSYLKWNSSGDALENDETIPDAVITSGTNASNAANSASAASTSETNAANSASAASTSETNAATSETNAANSASAASTSETNAATSETNAANSASAASTSETNAANSASAASNAATSETNAANSASAASTSETNAANSASAAEAAYDDFDDRYLGAKSSDPTLDNDGDALITGALYFNNASNAMKVYNGTTWDVITNMQKSTAAEIRTGTNNQKYVTPLGINDTVLGMGQTLQNMTSSRGWGVTYTNTTGKPIVVYARMYTTLVAAGHMTLNIEVDGVVRVSNGSNGIQNLAAFSGTIIVPPDSTYKFTYTSSLGTGLEVFELR